ncbi:non-ribosomal peptide synthetase [Ruegeria sp.]|uniref:amino acid adenylation domain-containing protein n=1 Tax=Ruegeria sp. TaxID=1879320 RepID=UPI0023093E2B|nr:non-ribosomal peptide synthetase [Ruegeria sp.]MDA7964899.1 amino acid adenylation domain-containing protein [Ruegeria sp.]
MTMLELLDTQQGIWTAQQIAARPQDYLIAHAIEVFGPLDAARMTTAIEQALAEADTVNATFAEVNGTARQDIPSAPVRPDIQVTDLTGSPDARTEAWHILRSDLDQGKDPFAPKHKLLRIGSDEGAAHWIWYQRYHHIMLDGYSLDVLTDRIIALYDAARDGTQTPPSPFTSVAEVVAEQHTYRESDAWRRDNAFWLAQCADLPAAPKLADSAKGTASIGENAQFSTILIDRDRFARFEARVDGHDFAAFDLLTAGIAAYVARISGQFDLVLGVPMMRRLGSAAISSSAPVVNVLPLRLRLNPAQDLLELAMQVRQAMRDMRKAQRYPVEQIQRDLGLTGTGQGMWSATLNFRLYEKQPTLAGHATRLHRLAIGPLEEPEFGLRVDDDGIHLDLRAPSDRYSQDDLARHTARLANVLDQFIATPEIPLADLAMTTEQERADLAVWQPGPLVATPPDEETLVDVLLGGVLAGNTDTVLRFGETTLSGADLLRRSCRLAHLLRDSGVGRGDVVAVALPRSELSVIAIFGVLISGATYLPMDIAYPKARLAAICEDALPRIILTTTEAAQNLPGGVPALHLDAPDTLSRLMTCPDTAPGPEQVRIRPEDTAYIVFTSGSTGRPKGVMVPHRALLNLFSVHRVGFLREALDHHLQTHPNRPLVAGHSHSFAFDAAWEQLFWMLMGQQVVVLSDAQRHDAQGFLDAVIQHRLDALDIPPSFCAQMLEMGLLTHPAHRPSVLLLGGEAMQPAVWNTLAEQEGVIAYNAYGPTEFTVDACMSRLVTRPQPVIGRPIGNAQAHVLDACLSPQPIGTVGELYLAGPNIATGYIGKPGLTAERFVPNPFATGQTLYRTGDRARWRDDSTIELLGRADTQVQVRGHRVEPSEVAAALAAFDIVSDAHVVAEPVHGSHRLLAYCTGNLDSDAIDLLRRQLSDRLPAYMVPSVIVPVEHFPLTVNGKIDPNALPKPQFTEGRSPRTAVEKVVCEVVGQVLGVAPIGLDHDFFASGGDSISAMVLCNEMRKRGWHLTTRDIFATPGLADLTSALEPVSADTEIAAPDVPNPSEFDGVSVEIAEILPLLPAQKGILFHATLGDAAGNYNAHTRLVLQGALDTARLRHAFDAVLRRHPQLAGFFLSDPAGDPYMALPADSHLRWPWKDHDISDLTGPARDHRLQQIEAAASRNLRLTRDPLCMVAAELVRLSPDHHVLLINIHHAIIDGWSTPILLRDLFDAYRDAGDSPRALDQSYGSVIRALASRDKTGAETFWAQQLQGCTPTCLFDKDRATGSVDEYHLTLTPGQSRALRDYAGQGGVTLNVVMQALWANVIGAVSGRQDVVFGTAVAGRAAPVSGIGDQIGMFLNTIPVRVDLDPARPVLTQLAQMQDIHAQAMEHDNLNLADLHRIAGVEALFDTLLVVENYPDNSYLDQDLDGLRVTDIHNRGYSHYPLALLVLPGDTISFIVESRETTMDAARVGRMLHRMIDALIQHPAASPAQLCLLPAPDAQVIEETNRTGQHLPDLTLHDLIAAQVGRTPDAPALEDADHRLSFRQTRHQVLHLADRLRQAGAHKGDVIGVALPRSARLSVAILAVIEIGAIYLPLDLSYPRDRLEFLQSDGRPSLVITQTGIDIGAATCPRLCFDVFAGPGQDVRDLVDAPDLSGRDPAYLLYTSGTTGRPKGALISHAAIVNRLLWMQAEYPLTGADAILQKTPCGFDVSVWEFFWSYLVGARLVMAPPDAHRDPQMLMELIRQHQITTMHFVPSVLTVFNEAMATAGGTPCPSLRQVFCSGEALSGQAVAGFARHCGADLHNLYGPTEAAIDVTYCPALPHADSATGVPIGKPVWNTGLRILDHLLRPVPVGVAGELYLCGTQLADGYLGRAALTSDRFVADPHADGQRMYRTGDLARWGDEGRVIYLGRTDHQIKIRGQRVEPQEIASSLLRQPDIAEAVVLAITPEGRADPDLVAYVVPQGPSFDPDATLAALAAQLPAYMVPRFCLVLERLPINANGKLDRRALPQPDTGGQTMGRAPAPGIEQDLARIFCDLLDVERVSATDDFFALGGHSLLAMRLAARIRQDLKRHIQVGQIMSMATVEHLARHLAAGALVGTLVQDGFDPVIHLRKGTGRPLICIHPGSGASWQYSVLARYLKSDMPIIGLQSPRPDGPIATAQNLDQLCDRHYDLVRELQPEGPYHLLGYSLGGNVAFGIAERLEAAGQQVHFLGLLDTYPAEHHDWTDPDGNEAEAGAEREQEQLLNDAMADVADAEFHREKSQMFSHIFDNYRDAVRLLSTARTGQFSGQITLFVADKSDLPEIDPDTSWLGHVGAQDVHHLPHASHEDIISPASLEVLGPLMNLLIAKAQGNAEEWAETTAGAA